MTFRENQPRKSQIRLPTINLLFRWLCASVTHLNQLVVLPLSWRKTLTIAVVHSGELILSTSIRGRTPFSTWTRDAKRNGQSSRFDRPQSGSDFCIPIVVFACSTVLNWINLPLIKLLHELRQVQRDSFPPLQFAHPKPRIPILHMGLGHHH